MTNANSLSSRYCQKCEKALKACICPFIQSIDCDIPLIILQHPSEVKKAVGTARILSLSLAKARLLVAENFSEHAELNQLLSAKDIEYALLYPSEKAISIETWQATTPSNKKQGLVLLDGTWRKTYKMYQLSTNIQKLQTLSLNVDTPSQYKIRKSSKQGGLSSVEAGFFALSQLANNPKPYQPLLTAFSAMVSFQLQFTNS